MSDPKLTMTVESWLHTKQVEHPDSGVVKALKHSTSGEVLSETTLRKALADLIASEAAENESN